MSYSKVAYEEIIIKNETNDTKAFVKSIKKYIMDFLTGVRIQELYSFEMELVADEILILGSYTKDKNGIGTINLQSNQVNEESIDNIIQNLEEYNNLKILLDYDGFFFSFYPYGVERISRLLHNNLNGKVNYQCNECNDQKSQMYVYANRNGELIQGVIKPIDMRQYSHIESWERIMLSFYAEFEEDISWELFRKIQEAAQEYCDRFGLDFKFRIMSTAEENAPLAEVSDIVIELKHNFSSENKKKDIVKFDEIVTLFDGLHSIYEIARRHLYSVDPEWLFFPLKGSNKFLEMRTSMDEGQNLVIGVYDINSSDVIPYHSSGDQMLDLIENIEGATIPFDVDFLE